jgi:hypothetical protein
MDANLAFILGVVAVAIVVAAAVFGSRRKTRRMRDAYGAEYLATLDEKGNRRRAEAELRRREKRVGAMRIRPLRRDEKELFAMRWRKVQAFFVDNPGAAIAQADDLLGQLMQSRGYPERDFDRRMADLSVHHGNLVSDYRSAHLVAQRHRKGDASTEDLRQAMMHYRALFDDLLEISPDERRLHERRTFVSDAMDEETVMGLSDEDYERMTRERDYPADRRPHH